jgi:hypothetical protein
MLPEGQRNVCHWKQRDGGSNQSQFHRYRPVQTGYSHSGTFEEEACRCHRYIVNELARRTTCLERTAIGLDLTANASQRCTTGKKLESCERNCRNRCRRRRLRHQNPSDQTPRGELGGTSERCRMDVGDGYGLHYDIRRIFPGPSIYPVTTTLAAIRVRNFVIYAYFSIIQIRRYAVVSWRPLP